MRKKSVLKLLFFTIILFVILNFIYENWNLANCMTGYILYTEKKQVESLERNTNNIYVYDFNNDTTSTYSLPDYQYIYSINKYYGGDFCCLGIKPNENINEILLFKDNKLEKTYSVSNNIEELLCYDNSIFFLSEQKLYKSSSSNFQPTIFTDDIVDYFDINQDGNILIGRRTNTSELFLSYYDKDNQKKDIGLVSSCSGWISKDSILVKKDNIVYTINVNNNKMKKHKYIDDFLTTMAISTKGGKVLNRFYAKGSEINIPCGIIDINKKKAYRYAFSERNFERDDIGNVGKYDYIWLDN